MATDHRSSKKRVCLGYGDQTGKCTNVAGTPWTRYWCTQCDTIRRADITRQLQSASERISRG